MESKLHKYASAVIVAFGLAATVYIFFRFVPRLIFPFLLGWLVSLILSPVARKLSAHTKMSPKISSGLTVILFFLCASLLVGLAVRQIALEVGELAQRLYRDPEMIAGAIEAAKERLDIGSGKLPFIDRLEKIEGMEKIASGIESAINGTVSGFMELLTSKIPSAAAGALSSLPDVLLFLVAFLLSAFYFCVDREKISAFLGKLLPNFVKERLPSLKERAGALCSKYLKAYLIIMLMTFGEVFLGLTVMNISYAFLLALIIAAIDVLPLLGTGIILVPWSIYCFIVSDSRRGIGLLVLFAVVSVVRQIAEPRIVGKSVGLHPLAMLFSVYAGIKLLGFWGIIIGPVAALIIKGLFFPAATNGEREQNGGSKPPPYDGKRTASNAATNGDCEQAGDS